MRGGNAMKLQAHMPTVTIGARDWRAAMIALVSLFTVSIIIVAHNYAHIFDVCDRVSLLQNGEITFDRLTKETSVEELMNLVLHELRSARERISRS